MQSFKILSSKAVKEKASVWIRRRLTVKSRFRLWKPRFDSLIVNSEKQFRIKLEYIHNNPVKAGFVNKSSDWLYSSAQDWLEGKTGLLPIDKNFSWVG